MAQTTHNFETSLSSHLFQVNANGTNIGQFVFQDVERAARLREGMERLVREVAALQLTVRNEVRAVDMTLRRGFNVRKPPFLLLVLKLIG